MQIANYKIFNDQELIAVSEFNGRRIELMELTETKLNPIYEKTPMQVLGSRAIQYKTSYIGIEGQAKVINILRKGQDIINQTEEHLPFMLYKDGITLHCDIEDVNDVVEGEYIYFTVTE